MKASETKPDPAGKDLEAARLGLDQLWDRHVPISLPTTLKLLLGVAMLVGLASLPGGGASGPGLAIPSALMGLTALVATVGGVAALGTFLGSRGVRGVIPLSDVRQLGEVPGIESVRGECEPLTLGTRPGLLVRARVGLGARAEGRMLGMRVGLFRSTGAPVPLRSAGGSDRMQEEAMCRLPAGVVAAPDAGTAPEIGETLAVFLPLDTLKVPVRPIPLRVAATIVLDGEAAIQCTGIFELGADERPLASAEPMALTGRCQVCGEDLRGPLVVCVACQSPAHRDCWRYVGRCSTFGCQGEDATEPRTPPPPGP